MSALVDFFGNGTAATRLAECAAFVLHDLFGLSFDEVEAALGRSSAACRQLAFRDRTHVQERRPRFDVDPTVHHEVVDAFASAATSADLDGLLRLLAPDAVLTADGGGIVHAARHPIVGATKVGAFLVGVSKRPGPRKSMRAAVVNHNPALLVFLGAVSTAWWR